MTRDGIANSRPIAGDNVYYSIWDTSSFDKLAGANCSERRNFRWLNDDSVTGGQR